MKREMRRDEKFIEEYMISPKEVKNYNRKLIFDSIYYPGHKINKTAYIFELATSRNLPISQIKQMANCGYEKVMNVLKMISLGAPQEEFYQEKKLGRNLKVTEEIQHQLMLKASGSLSDSKLAEELNNQFHLKDGIKRTTINFYRHKFGFEYKPPKKRQQLTEDQKEKRLIFASSILNIPDFPWKKIIFSDESRICLKNDGNWVWRKRGLISDEIFEDQLKYSTGIMIYGAIGLNYKSKLIFTDVKIDSCVYAGNIEESGMLDLEEDFIFMQDGAKCHTSKEMKDWLNSRCNFIDFWPPNSPDLNPIEMLWAIIKNKLQELPFNLKPKNCKDLQLRVVEIWENIDFQTINNLIESFYYRLVLVIRNNGESIQPFYKHNHSNSPEDYKEEVEEFLLYSDLRKLFFDEIVILKNPNKPSPEDFIPYHLHQNSSPSDSKFKKWTPEEDAILLQKKALGFSWSKIAFFLPGRTSASVKARYNSKSFVSSLQKNFP